MPPQDEQRISWQKNFLKLFKPLARSSFLRPSMELGSDMQFKMHLLDALMWHKDPKKAHSAIWEAIEGLTYGISFSVPLNKLLEIKRMYKGKTDAEKVKLCKLSNVFISQKADEDQIGGDAICQACLMHCCKSTPPPLSLMLKQPLTKLLVLLQPGQQISKKSSDKENIKTVGSIPRTPASPSPSLKRSRSDDAPAPHHLSKHIRKSNSDDSLDMIKSILEEQQKKHEEHEARILAQMEHSNTRYEENSESTKDFQHNFLNLLCGIVHNK
ncbi:hypothetical protein L208DRAFT_1380557 [Tricholoma matsutake]|nr:hypothetical protein L208DRAFT_1380557 [Tricholoma matsutake 945]